MLALYRNHLGNGCPTRVIIFHARRSLQTATAADDPVASPARTVPRAASRISF